MIARRVAVSAVAALLVVGAVACSSPSDEALHPVDRTARAADVDRHHAPRRRHRPRPPPATRVRASDRRALRSPTRHSSPPTPTMATIRDDGHARRRRRRGHPGVGLPRSEDRPRSRDSTSTCCARSREAIFRDGDPDAHLKFKTLTTAERIAAVAERRGRHGGEPADRDLRALGERSNFSTEYYEAHQDVLVPDDSDDPRPSTISAGKTVCATRGSTSIDAHPRRSCPTAVLYPVAARAECLVALQEGTVDAITSDDTILAQLPGPGEAADDPTAPRRRVLRIGAVRDRDRQGPRGPRAAS